MTKPRPDRCKDGRRPSVVTVMRLAPADRDFLRRLGDGNLTRGVEYLISTFRKGKP